MGSDGDAEMLLALELEGSVGEVREGKVCRGFIGFGEPALVRIRCTFRHGA